MECPKIMQCWMDHFLFVRLISFSSFLYWDKEYIVVFDIGGCIGLLDSW